MNNNGVRADYVSTFPKYADSCSSFNLFVNNPQEPFDGTIVRIPLRTHEQAEASKIVQLAITLVDVLKELKAFQKEVAESLLFLKSIEKIEFRIDNHFLGAAEVTNVQETFAARTAIKSAITAGISKSLSFQLHIRHQYHHDEHEVDLHQQYHVQHKLADINADNSLKTLKKWAARESFFPWIALAAPLDLLPARSSIQSRIFVSLPLPILLLVCAAAMARRSKWRKNDQRDPMEYLSVQEDCSPGLARDVT